MIRAALFCMRLTLCAAGLLIASCSKAATVETSSADPADPPVANTVTEAATPPAPSPSQTPAPSPTPAPPPTVEEPRRPVVRRTTAPLTPLPSDRAIRSGEAAVTTSRTGLYEWVDNEHVKRDLDSGYILDVDEIDDVWVKVRTEFRGRSVIGWVLRDKIEAAPQLLFRYTLKAKRLEFPETTRPHQLGAQSATKPVGRPAIIAALAWYVAEHASKGNGYLRDYERTFRAAIGAGGMKPDPTAAALILEHRIVLRGSGSIQVIDPALESYLLTRSARLLRLAGADDGRVLRRLDEVHPNPKNELALDRIKPQLLAGLDGLAALGRVETVAADELIQSRLASIPPGRRVWNNDDMLWVRARLMRLRTEIERRRGEDGRVRIDDDKVLNQLADQLARGLFKSDMQLLFVLAEVRVLMEDVAGDEAIEIEIRPDQAAFDTRGISVRDLPAIRSSIKLSDLLSVKPLAEVRYDHAIRAVSWNASALIGPDSGSESRRK